MLNIKIKEIRRSKKITQKQLSQILNVDTSTICLWEKGKRKPSMDSFRKMLSCNLLTEKDIYLIENNKENTNEPNTVSID